MPTEPMSESERAVWQAVQAMNEVWTSGRVDELERFFHSDMVAVTPTDRDPLVGRRACVASWRRFVEMATIHDWTVSDPRVRVYGDAAVVSYCYELDCEIGGERIDLAGRDLFFMVRQGDRWIAVADQFSAFPAAPMEPPPATTAAVEGSAGPEIPATRHVLTIFAVADLERAVRFYREAFGWPTRIEVPVFVELELPDGRGIGLYKRGAFAQNTGQLPESPPAGAITATELYFHCDDLDSAIFRLEQAGAHLLSARAPRGWGDEAAYFADPDGNVLVVARPLD